MMCIARSTQRLAWLLVLLHAACLLAVPLTVGRAQELPPAAPTPTLYLPIVANSPTWDSPFGVQIDGPQPDSAMLNHAADLQIGWLRNAISWRTLQPDQDGPFLWERLAEFEQTTRLLKERGIRTQVVIFDSPAWATINSPHPTSCGAIRADRFAHFATFLQQVIERYKVPDFDIHDWELGNEVDVDPRLVGADSAFGCWGDIDDPFYGGRHYGAMLNAVAPVMRAADSHVRIWHGGLLMDRPETTNPVFGHPERFLNGVLEAGAGSSFDVLAFHAYASYLNKRFDHESSTASTWGAIGGTLIGKVRFLRNVMQQYGVSKPLFANETALTCPEATFYRAWCVPASPSYYAMQSVYLVQSFTRGLAEGLVGINWFCLNGPGWRSVGLVHGDTRMPAFTALQQFTTQLRWAELTPRPVDYGSAIEAYSFHKPDVEVHVIWARQDKPVSISLPRDALVSVADLDGRVVTPVLDGDMYEITVPFEPIYITVRRP